MNKTTPQRDDGKSRNRLLDYVKAKGIGGVLRADLLEATELGNREWIRNAFCKLSTAKRLRRVTVGASVYFVHPSLDRDAVDKHFAKLEAEHQERLRVKKAAKHSEDHRRRRVEEQMKKAERVAIHKPALDVVVTWVNGVKHTKAAPKLMWHEQLTGSGAFAQPFGTYTSNAKTCAAKAAA